jgi:segregation and condensation protein A
MIETTPPYEIVLPIFQGPLDLLLHLIEKEELEITKVALAQVTDQYLARLRLLEELSASEITAFLVIAAKLLLIKSQVLLPRPPEITTGGEEEEDVGDELARQLIEYKRFKEIALSLREREESGLRSFVRVAPPPALNRRLDLADLSLQDLVEAVRAALSAAAGEDEGAPVSDVVRPATVTIEQQMALIEQALRRHGQISFQRLLGQASSRVEIIVTFLAVLELIKQQQVDVRQERLFGEVIITAIAVGEGG